MKRLASRETLVPAIAIAIRRQIWLVEQIVWRLGRYRNTPAWAASEAARKIGSSRAEVLEAFINRDGPGAAQAIHEFVSGQMQAFQRELG